MMNFKKNQNNAVCSMDCKNCPHGASQPNPMDDPMFEKSIAMLHNWLMLEAIREDHPKERIVMVILPGAGGELLTEDGSRDIFEDVYDEMEADLVADGELLLHYDKSDVIETDRTRYLLGAAGVSEIDQNGNECSINLFTLERNGDSLFPAPAAAGVEYLLADPAPESVPRQEVSGEEADLQPTYPLNGLLLDNESIYRAMDTRGTGEFVPLNFSAKTGRITNSKGRLADEAKLRRIRDHLDGLLTQMAQDLYSGEIDAKPLCSGARSPCTYCEFRMACRHRDGEHERTPAVPDEPFEE